MTLQKICWEEPEKQKTRSCRAQELSRSCAQWKGRNEENGLNQSILLTAGSKNHKGARGLVFSAGATDQFRDGLYRVEVRRRKVFTRMRSSRETGR